jgi:hypothetical protein
MLTFRNKAVKFALVAAGLVLLAPVPANASPTRPDSPAAGSSPTTTGATAASGRAGATATSGRAGAIATSGRAGAAAGGIGGPARLRAALLGARDLPGYSPTTSGYVSTVSSLSTDTNICDHKVGSQAHTPSAQAAFIGGIPGPMLFETLSVTGARTARAIVAGIAAAPRLCRSFNGSAVGMNTQLRISSAPAPRLGDASSAVRFVVRPAATTMVIEGNLISVARGNVAVTLIQINGGSRREFETVAAAAIRKLDRVM